PRAVALVGVSGRADSLIARPLRYLVEHGFAGAIYPVNPNYDRLQGLPCYASLEDVPGPVDLVLVLVPAAKAAEVVRQAGSVGATAAVVFASGFAETGEAGAILQQQLQEAGQAAGVRVLGPNCQGLLHAPSGLAATFTAAADRRIDSCSGVAYVGQSGAVGGSVLDLANEMGLGLTAWVSTGNQADLDLVQVAMTLLEDPAIEVVMLYAEAIGDGAAYTRLAGRARELGKHLVVLRSGHSDVGRRAAASHTGSMLGDDIAFVLTSRRYGVILVDDVDELLAVAATVRSAYDLNGRRVGVITTSGGAGSLTADHCVAHGLDLPVLAPATQSALTEYVPEFGALANPVDVTAQLFNREGHARALGEVCTIVAGDPDVDIIAVVLTMVTGEAGAMIAEDLVATATKLQKPLFVTWLAGLDQTREGRQIFRSAGVPVFGSVGDLTRTAGLLAPTPTYLSETPTGWHHSGTPDGPTPGDDAALLLDEYLAGRASGSELLTRLGISQPASFLATDETSAVEAAFSVGAPLAMKIQARSLLHKSDLGGVRLAVDPADAAQRYHELVSVARTNGLEDLDGILIQEMIHPGPELIVGATCSSDGFPPVVTVGMGGVTTEIYQDVVSELAPVGADDAERMLRGLRGWPLLDGYRGSPPADVQAAARVIASVSRMVAAVARRFMEVEINPLIVGDRGSGAFAVDLLARGGRTASDPPPEKQTDAATETGR
ncbi:MAG: acetate--CoA ligase family protein, partial [Nocardioidaceae bacterium]